MDEAKKEQLKLVLARARQMAEGDNPDEAARICYGLLEDHPNDVNAIVILAYTFWKAKRSGAAYQLAMRATQLAPANAVAWINLGLACDELWLIEEAEDAYRMAARLSSDPSHRAMALSNMGALAINTGRFVEAEKHCREALKDNPESIKAKANLGFAQLGQRNWEGWVLYSQSLGFASRRKWKFLNEPDWDGTPGKTVAIYGEQGLGDEISFASMIPAAVKDCAKLVVECDKRLTGLFTRSFPEAKVYGTREQKVINWDKIDRQLDASCAMGELGLFYRKRDEDFDGKPYLVADPDRRMMWRTLFDSKKKPCIGIAWTGGMPWTAKRFRTLNLEMLRPVLEAVEAHWVSLQYEDAGPQIERFRDEHPEIDIAQYAFATLSKDYDDTAAMVAELDMVICVQTAVAHLAGGLGKECHVLLPRTSQWRYGEKGDTMPWYASLRVIRQRELGKWEPAIGEVVGMLRRRYPVQEAA